MTAVSAHSEANAVAEVDVHLTIAQNTVGGLPQRPDPDLFFGRAAVKHDRQRAQAERHPDDAGRSASLA